MPIEARRHNPRVKLNEAAYINFGSGNRGVILDVSEGGLRFKTTSPLKGADLVRFWLMFSRRSEATAALAWSDETCAVGGLRFTKLSPDIRGQIRLWIDRSLARGIYESLEVGEPGGAGNDFLASVFGDEISDEAASSLEPALAQSVVSDSLPEAGVGAAAVAEGQTPQAQPSATAVESLPATDSSPATGPDPAKGFVYGRPALVPKPDTLSMFPAQGAPQTARTAAGASRHRLAIAVLVMLLALVAAAGAAAYYRPSAARHMMTRVQAQVIRLINRPAYKRSITDVEPAAMGSAPESNSGGVEGSLELPAPVVPGTPNAPRSPDASASQPLGSDNSNNQDAAPAKDNSQVDMNLVQKYLTPGSTPDEKQKAVRLLWHATEKGNVDAEIQLADLYARGDSVPKSCVQARILLKAAATVNPSLAQPKLAELDDAGCS